MDNAVDFGYVTGKLDVASSNFGIMNVTQPTVVAFFRLAADVQSHPIRAINRLALVVHCYCKAAEQQQEPFLDVAVNYTLVSGSESSVIMAKAINWYTSPELRRMAEANLAEMTGKGRGGSRMMARWPWKEITLPVSFQPAIIDPKSLQKEK
jgi:hypothetical protein